LSVTSINVAFGQHKTINFPDDWIGKWAGNLNIYQGQKIAQTLPMQLIIEPLDSVDHYSWSIIYGEDTIAGLRPYTLKTIDKAKGHYIIDEHNSILLDAYVHAQSLFSHFDVMGSYLTSIYSRKENDLIFEIIVNKSNPSRTTGGTNSNGEEIPIVNAYPIVGYQRAILKKQ
jgi:hypothetical protein